jgi:hypothetical protein
MVRYRTFFRGLVTSLIGSLCVAGVIGCGNTQVQPSNEDAANTKKMIEGGPASSMPSGMPPSMLQGGSPEQQLKSATGSSPSPGGSAGIPQLTP